MRIELHFELSVSPKVVDDHFTTQNSISIDNLNVVLKKKHVMQRVKTASILNRFQLATRNSLKRNSYTNTKSYDTGSSMINLYEA